MFHKILIMLCSLILNRYSSSGTRWVLEWRGMKSKKSYIYARPVKWIDCEKNASTRDQHERKD